MPDFDVAGDRLERCITVAYIQITYNTLHPSLIANQP